MRERQGLSQRELARKAGIAYKTLQLLESGRHDPRWSTLVRIASALGRRAELQEAATSSLLGPTGDSISEISSRIVEEGEDSWRLWLFNFVDAFERRPDRRWVVEAPDPRVPHPVLALLASTVEFLCRKHGISVPWWCAGVPPLSRPWFVAGIENLKAAALAESPAQFRRRNIFVLSNFLERA